MLFTVKPKRGLPTDTQITNQARIVFDVNAPIDTPQWLNTIDNSKPESRVLALTATQSSVHFPVQWSGTDTGSGIGNYTIFVSENGGPFTIWLDKTTATSGTFDGQAEKTYSFYSVAQDQTGNREDNKTSGEAATTTPPPAFEPVVLTTSAATLKTWTFSGRTFVYVKLTFPDAGFRVVDFGSPVRSGSDFSADARVEDFTGASVQAVKTTAQIYDLGALTAGNYNFIFKNSGTVVKSLAFTVSSGPPAPNVIDDQRQFVRQQYLDFLSREPDGPGWDFWTDNITRCSDPARRPAGQTEAQCIDRQRETTSAAFFLSPEFQNTGYFVLRVFRGSLNRMPFFGGSVPADNAKDEFTRDATRVSAGIVVNNNLSAAVINSNKQAFVNEFVNRPEFKAIYDGLNSAQYVDKLFQTTGVVPTDAERTTLINGLSTGGSETRASVLFKIVDGTQTVADGALVFQTRYGKAFYDQQFNPGFVQMEYFGYMKRDPDDPGFAFRLGKLNSFGNFLDAEMVKAFIVSPEYRARFGQP